MARRAACYAGISVIRLLAGRQVDSHTECAILAASPALASRLYTASAGTGPEAGHIQPKIQP
jgi:hypothetical protein